jgi:hypothetical protein
MFICVVAAHAAQANFYVMGAGTDSCGKLTNNYRINYESSRLTYGHWLAGFMTGVGMMCKTVVMTGMRARPS